MTRKEFIALVVSEIENIKQKATAEEVSNLNFSRFSPLFKTTCIYGQMTGNCFSERANELKCNIFEDVPDSYCSYTHAKKHFLKKGDTFSALEFYIILKGAKNEEIIQYLKGEIDKLPEL